MRRAMCFQYQSRSSSFWRQMLKSPRTLSTNSILELGSVWFIPDKHRDVIGTKSLILTAADDHSKSLAQRMWFDLQRVGKQSVFATMTTPYPTLSSIGDATKLYRRAGCRSIITIGSAATSDFGKSMRHVLEFGATDKVPLICAGTTWSVLHAISSHVVLDQVEDILTKSSSRPPEVRHQYIYMCER